MWGGGHGDDTHGGWHDAPAADAHGGHDTHGHH